MLWRRARVLCWENVCRSSPRRTHPPSPNLQPPHQLAKNKSETNREKKSSSSQFFLCLNNNERSERQNKNLSKSHIFCVKAQQRARVAGGEKSSLKVSASSHSQKLSTAAAAAEKHFLALFGIYKKNIHNSDEHTRVEKKKLIRHNNKKSLR